MSSLVAAELVAVVIGVEGGAPVVLGAAEDDALPHGPLEPAHRSLQAGVRSWVREHSAVELGYVEQLYTFADRGRATQERTVAISYLGLTHATDSPRWRELYELLPWEDRRASGAGLDAGVEDALRRWAGDDEEARARVAHTFGLGGEPWQPDLVLQRYELLWQVGLVAESAGEDAPGATGRPMVHDHRRILATGLARLRSTLQYRPLIFELLPEEFTLGHLQATVEALAGQGVHKPNFRRLVLQQAQLVEPTGRTSRATGGRPAQLYRFRREVHAERRHVGTKLPRPKVR
ncbi:NUDIX hydrolase [Kytococcus sp. Marseille-QA3725]